MCDQQLEAYRIWVKTKKWTLKIALHFIDLAIVNARMEEVQTRCSKYANTKIRSKRFNGIQNGNSSRMVSTYL